MNARKLVAVTLFAVLVYAGFVFFNDVTRLRAALSHFEWWTFFAALALASGNYVLRFFKWQYYLARLEVKGVPWTESFVIFLSGFAMSITPAKAGEVFKSALLASARGVPIIRTAPVVIADRLTDLISLIMIAAVGSYWFEGGRIPAVVATAMVSTLLLFVFVPALGEAVIKVAEKLPLGKKLAPKARQAYAALQVLAGPSALVFPTMLSLVAWGLECVALWVIVRGLGHEMSMARSFFIYAVSTVAGAVAMIPGGIGVTEGTMDGLLMGLGGAPQGPAAAATLLVRFATLWFAVVVGLIALAVFRRLYDRNVAVPSDSSPPA